MKYRVEREGPMMISISVPPGATDETLDGESLYEQLEALLAAHPHVSFSVLHDLRRTPRSPIRRKRFTDWVRSNRSRIEARISSYAIVAGSSLQQGMITAVLWVLEPPIPWRAFTQSDAARAWLEAERR